MQTCGRNLNLATCKTGKISKDMVADSDLHLADYLSFPLFNTSESASEHADFFFLIIFCDHYNVVMPNDLTTYLPVLRYSQTSSSMHLLKRCSSSLFLYCVKSSVHDSEVHLFYVPVIRYVDDGRPFWQYIVSSSTGCSNLEYFEELYKYYTTEKV